MNSPADRTGSVDTTNAHGEAQPASRSVRVTKQSPRWRTAFIALIVSALFSVGIDLVSKSLAFAKIADTPVVINRQSVIALNAEHQNPGVLIPQHDAVVVVPGLLELKLVLNPGAVFGIGAGKRLFFVLFTGVALCFGLWAFRAWTTPRNRLAHIGLGLIIGGGIGNLYDRIVFGCVRDFLHPLANQPMPFGWNNPFSGSPELWPYVSNFADLWLLIGIGFLLWHLLRHSNGHSMEAGDASAQPNQDAGIQTES